MVLTKRICPFANARVSLFSRDEGGLKGPLPNGYFSCPLFFRDVPALSTHGYDGRMLIGKHDGSIGPGVEIPEVKILFLSPEEVFPNIKRGVKFDLWHMRMIGFGEMLGTGFTDVDFGDPDWDALTQKLRVISPDVSR